MNKCGGRTDVINFLYLDEDLSDIKLTVFKMMIFTAEETSQEKGGGKVFRQKLPASSPLGEPSPRSLPIKLKKHAWNFQVDCLSTVMHDYTGSFVLETRRRLRLGFYANWAPNSWALGPILSGTAHRPALPYPFVCHTIESKLPHRL